MDFEITPDDIDSREKHEAFLTLHGEEAYEELTADEDESGSTEGGELPEGQLSREEFESLSPARQKAFIDEGGEVVAT